MERYENISAMQFSPDGKTFWATTGTVLKAWQVQTQRELGSLPLNGRIGDFSLSSDQQYIGYCDNTLNERRLMLLRIPPRTDVDAQLVTESEHSGSSVVRARIPGATLLPAGDETIEPAASDMTAP